MFFLKTRPTRSTFTSTTTKRCTWQRTWNPKNVNLVTLVIIFFKKSVPPLKIFEGASIDFHRWKAPISFFRFFLFFGHPWKIDYLLGTKWLTFKCRHLMIVSCVMAGNLSCTYLLIALISTLFEEHALLISLIIGPNVKLVPFFIRPLVNNKD